MNGARPPGRRSPGTRCTEGMAHARLSAGNRTPGRVPEALAGTVQAVPEPVRGLTTPAGRRRHARFRRNGPLLGRPRKAQQNLARWSAYSLDEVCWWVPSRERVRGKAGPGTADVCRWCGGLLTPGGSRSGGRYAGSRSFFSRGVAPADGRRVPRMVFTGDKWIGVLLQVVITIGLGAGAWAVARSVISRIVGRVSNGYAMLKKPHFRWAQPVLRTLDHERRVQRAETIGSLLTSIVAVLVVVTVIIYTLGALEVNVAPLLTSVGILGIAIGFGAQQLIRDFLAGIFITLEDQYGIGDVIETSEVVGTVESVGLRITRVRAGDGTIWYLRNGEILRVGNRSQGSYLPSTKAGSPDEALTRAGK